MPDYAGKIKKHIPLGNNISYKIKNQLKKLLFKKRFLNRFNHNIKSFEVKAGSSTFTQAYHNDTKLVERLKSFYILCNENFDGNGDSVWSEIFNQLHGDIHTAFINRQQKQIVDILRNPKMNNLFYGFENLCKDLIKTKRLEDILAPEMTMDSLLSFCEAVGIKAIVNPESLRITKTINAQNAIDELENTFQVELQFPNPFEGEFGIETKRGILSYRAVQALYQAWRISEIIKDIPNPRILEIGGGLGRTAYFSRFFKVFDYTIVDIPISSLAQGNFLGRVFDENYLQLIGEPIDPLTSNLKIKLIHPNAFFSSEIEYDLIVNFDSLTELNSNIAKKYFQKINECGNRFLSINHEFNSFTINSIWKEMHGTKRILRYPTWVRKGYVEELFEKI